MNSLQLLKQDRQMYVVILVKNNDINITAHFFLNIVGTTRV